MIASEGHLEERLKSQLGKVLSSHENWVIAVSGGVDSLTLATFAHRVLAHPPRMLHAVSPAVPQAAWPRITALAQAEGWRLEQISPREIDDPNYRENPYNRCYYCKSALYKAVLSCLPVCANEHIASGANLDDLQEHRPGLLAAGEAGVRHPLIEAGIDKAGVRCLARALKLAVHDLPAEPCIASRIETGLPVLVEDLYFVDTLETALRKIVGQQETLRVRVRHTGVALEVGPVALSKPDLVVRLVACARKACHVQARPFLGLSNYRRGSAFVAPVL